MSERSVEDRLREQYFDLLPDIRRVAQELETEIKYCLLRLSLKLNRYERLIVSSRIKECQSAVNALRRRQEGAVFNEDKPELYTLEKLRDLAGVRVSVFPGKLWQETNLEVRKRLPDREPDPIRHADGELMAFKYHGSCKASNRVGGECQIVPLLTTLFWEVEHVAIYKPAPSLKDVASNPRMKERTDEVTKALKAFEEEFETLLEHDPLGGA